MYLNIIMLQILDKLKNLMNYSDNESRIEINRLIEFLTLMIDDKLGMPTNKIESTRILNRIFVLIWRNCQGIQFINKTLWFVSTRPFFRVSYRLIQELGQTCYTLYTSFFHLWIFLPESSGLLRKSLFPLKFPVLQTHSTERLLLRKCRDEERLVSSKETTSALLS